MTDGFAKLDSFIERIEAIPGIARNAAPDVAAVVERELVQSIRQGESPSGEKWKRRKDGGLPLQGAEKSLAVVAVGTRVIATITRHIARHHKGRARGGIVRRVLPVGGSIPGDMARQIRATLSGAFRSHMRGR